MNHIKLSPDLEHPTKFCIRVVAGVRLRRHEPVSARTRASVHANPRMPACVHVDSQVSARTYASIYADVDSYASAPVYPPSAIFMFALFPLTFGWSCLICLGNADFNL